MNRNYILSNIKYNSDQVYVDGHISLLFKFFHFLVVSSQTRKTKILSVARFGNTLTIDQQKFVTMSPRGFVCQAYAVKKYTSEIKFNIRLIG